MHTINIVGTIGEAVTAESVRTDLALAGNAPLRVLINSAGGVVQDGVAIYEMLRAHPAPVTVEVTGWALSVASVIAMAGSRVRIAPAGLFMLHNPWTSATGDAAALRKTASNLDVIRSSLMKAYARTGAGDAQIERWLDAETWFDADQALSAGLADEVIPAPTEALAGIHACAFEIPAHLKEKLMQTPTPTPASIPTPKPPAVQPVRSQAQTEELLRDFEVGSKLAGIQPAALNALMLACLKDQTVTPEEAGRRILALAARDVEPVCATHVETIYGSDYRDSEFKAACSDVLLARAGVPVADPHPASRDVQRLSVAGMAERILSMHGRSVTGMGKAEVIQAALSTSDFPELLANTTGRALRAGYENAPASHELWTADREVSDFKTQTLVSLSEAPGLEKVAELGEYTHGNFSEAAESFAIETFGKIITISRQALINDDLGAFTRIPQAFGASARRLEADHIYGKLINNPTMGDGKTLFHADHGNLGTAAELSVAAIGAARAAMRKQKGLAGVGYFDPQPRFLIVPVSLETTAEALLASLADPASANSGVANPTWVRGLVLVADPRLDADSETAWYLAADPRQIETIVRAYLAGEPRPYLEENSEFVRDALSHKCRMDFGVGVIDYRGLYKNPGA